MSHDPTPRAWVLFAHCFECDPGPADRIAFALEAQGLGVVRVPEPTREALLAAAADHPPRIVVGHARGGVAALEVARELDGVRAVATIATPADEVEGWVAELGKALLVFHAPTDATVGVDHARRLFQAAKHPKTFVSLDDADHALSGPADAEYVATVLAAWATRYVDAPLRAERPRPVEGHVVVRETGTGRFRAGIAAGPHHIVADEPRGVGGDDSGPTPYDLLLSALGACTTMTLRMYSERKGFALDRSTVTLQHSKVHARDCEDCESETGMVDRITRVVRLEGALSDEDRARLMVIADKCPVHRTLHGEVQVKTTEG